jgi:hypothetical protein
MDNPFSWDYLTAPIEQTPTFGPLSSAFFVLMVVTFVFAIFVYVFAPRRIHNNPVLVHALRFGSQWMLWLCGVALFFFAFRLGRVDVFTLFMRLWSYLFFLAYVASVGYFVYYLKMIYPQRVEELNRRAEIRRYNPKATVPRQVGHAPRRAKRRSAR